MPKIDVPGRVRRLNVKIPDSVKKAEAAFRTKPCEKALKAYLQTIVWWYGVEHSERRVGFDEIMRSLQAITIIKFLADKLVAPAEKSGRPPGNQNHQYAFHGLPFGDLEGSWLVYQVDLIRSRGSRPSAIEACKRLKERVEAGRYRAPPGNYVTSNTAKTLAEHYSLAKRRLEHQKAA